MAEVAKRLGKPLMPHQRHMVDVALEIDPTTGYLAYSRVIVIGPRQGTGKSELVLDTSTHRCVGFDEKLTGWVRAELGFSLPPPGPQRVLYIAQGADKARKVWRDVHIKRLEASKFFKPTPQFTTRLQRNLEAIIWANGSMWSPEGTTALGEGVGDTTDVVMIDEAWSRPDTRTELGIAPTMMTRPWRQLWILSMIPGLVRKRPGEWLYLQQQRALGRAAVEAGVRSGIACFDFAAPEGSDPADPETWYAAIPGLGRTVSEAAVRELFESPGLSLVDFCAELLGWEPKDVVPRWLLVRESTWSKDCLDAGSYVAEDSPRALAAEVNIERTRGWIGVAGFRPDGHYHVEIVEPGFKVAASTVGIDWMERRLVELAQAERPIRPCTVVLDPSRPAASLAVPLKRAGVDVTLPTQPEVAGACGRFFDATGEVRPEEAQALADGGEELPLRVPGVRVFHLGQAVLDRAMSQARPYYVSQGAFVFVRRSTSGEIGPLYAATLALHGLAVKGEAPGPEPDIFV